MKKICIIFSLAAIFICGCESYRKTTKEKTNAVAFPKELVAVWEGYYSQIHWVIKFTQDGRIEYAKIPWGQFVGPNSEATFSMQGDNNTMVVKTGDFLVDYKPDGTLNVSLEIINIDAMTPAGRMEMRGTEYLLGKVDIEKGVWNATWFTDGNYWLTPTARERVMLPNEDDSGNEIILKRLTNTSRDNPLK